MKFTIFISYTSKDKQLVTALSNRLATLSDALPNSYELKLWDMDVDCLGKWDDTCKNALMSSNVVISLLTSNVYASSYVHSEVDLAKEYCDKGELKFIPVALTEKPVRNDLGAYTTVFCKDGNLTDNKLDEIYAKVESYMKEILRLPYTSDTVERITSRSGCKFFVGRENKFEEIKRHFDNGRKTIVLTGLGGIGKTELAKNFVLKYGAEYPNSFIIKVNVADADTTAARSAKDLVRSIRFESTPTNTDDVELIFNKNLECLKSLDKKTILIIDGYDVNLDLVKDLWQIFDNLNCEVIFTSRQKSEIIPIVDVTELTDTDALQIFEKYCPAVSETDALAIADGVNYHTLTLELAARLLGQSKLVTPERLKESVFDVKSRIPHDRDNKTATIFEHIANIFDLANLSQFKKTVLAVLCRIPAQGLSFDELIKLANVNEENEYELNELIDAGLVRYDENYSLHTVIAEVAFRKLELSDKQELGLVYFLIDKIEVNLDNQFKQTYSLLEYTDYYVKKRLAERNDKAYMLAIAKLCVDTSNIARYTAQFVFALEMQNKALQIQLDNNLHADVAANYCAIAQIYAGLNDFDVALKYYDKAAEIFQLYHAENSVDAAQMYSGQALIYNIYKNDKETAKKLYEKALTIMTSQLDKNDLRLAQTYTEIGHFVQSTGKTSEESSQALELFGKALKIQINQLGEDNPLTSLTYTYMGICYYHMLQFDKTFELLQKAMPIQVNFYGENNPVTAITCLYLGHYYYSSNNNETAFTYYERALKIQLATVGENNADTAAAYIGLADIFVDKQKYDEALANAKKALSISLNIFGKNNPFTANCYNVIGYILCHKGETEQALQYLENSLSIYKETQYENHPDTASLHNSIATAYFDLKKYEQALPHFHKTLDIQLRAYDKQIEAIIPTFYNIASCYHNLEDYSNALQYYCYALANQIKIYGEEHEEVEETIDNIESLLWSAYYSVEEESRVELISQYLNIIASALGEETDSYAFFVNLAIDILYDEFSHFDAILAYCLENIERLQKLHGKVSSTVAAAYAKAAMVYSFMEQYEDALKYYCLSLKTLRDQTDNRDAEYLTEHVSEITEEIEHALNCIAELDDDDEIEIIFKNAIEFAENTLGKDSIYVEVFLSAMADWYADRYYEEEAVELYERALAILTLNGDENSEMLENIYHNLGVTYNNLQQFSKALEYAERALEIIRKNNGDTTDVEELLEIIKENMN